MTDFKVGVISDSFRVGTREGILKAREVGADGVQVWVVDGDTAPERMNADDRRDFKAFCARQNLEIAALCGDLGGHGFQQREENTTKVPRSKAIVDLAVDLGTSVVTTHIGVVPEDVTSDTYAIMVEACREIGLYAEARGVQFAIETGPEPAARLKQFLQDVDTAGMAVNFDPANLFMVLGLDPAQEAIILGNHIVHTHAKDGKRYAPCDPVKVYEAFAVGGIEGLNFGEYFDEVPLGQGGVDWERYLSALRTIGYSGFLTIEREVGDSPEDDIRLAVEFLRSL